MGEYFLSDGYDVRNGQGETLVRRLFAEYPKGLLPLLKDLAPAKRTFNFLPSHENAEKSLFILIGEEDVTLYNGLKSLFSDAGAQRAVEILQVKAGRIVSGERRNAGILEEFVREIESPVVVYSSRSVREIVPKAKKTTVVCSSPEISKIFENAIGNKRTGWGESKRTSSTSTYRVFTYDLPPVHYPTMPK